MNFPAMGDEAQRHRRSTPVTHGDLVGFEYAGEADGLLFAGVETKFTFIQTDATAYNDLGMTSLTEANYDIGRNIIAPQFAYLNLQTFQPTVVPLPAAVWLLGSAMGGLGYLRRRAAC